MDKFSKISTALLCLCVIIFFLIYTIYREKGDESFQENRELAKLPEHSLAALADGSFTRDFSDCFTDQFAGRSHWISLRAVLEVQIGENIVNDIYVDDDMLLNAKTDSTIPAESIASEINAFAADYDGALYFTAVPSSSGVYSDRLPEYRTYNTEKQQIDALYSALDQSVRKIDSYSILKMLNENYIYYRNDTKWTSYGAYCVYRTVIQKLGFLPVAYDKYTIEHVTGDFRGNLYHLTQYTDIKADMLDIYSYDIGENTIVSCTATDSKGNVTLRDLYDKSYIGTNDMYKLYLGEEAPLVKIKTTVNNDKKLLVIKDEYANCFIPFLTQHYSEIDIISPKAIDCSISKYVEKNDYAQTLFLFGVENLFDDDILRCINN